MQIKFNNEIKNDIDVSNKYSLEINKFLNKISERLKQMESSILVIDRIEGDYAVCENRDSGEILNIKIEQLPENVKEGSILKRENDKYIIDDKSEQKISNRIKDKMNKLWNN